MYNKRMAVWMAGVFFAAQLMPLGGSARAAGAAAEFIDVITMPADDRVAIVFNELPSYEILEEQKTLILDCKNCLHEWELKSVNIGSGGMLQKVSTEQYRLRPRPVVRVYFHLAGPYSYTVEQQKGALHVSFTAKDDAAQSAAPASAITTKVSAEPPARSAVKKPPARKAPAKKKVVASSRRRVLPLLERMTKKKVSLDFNQADVRDVIRLLSAKCGINMIYGEDVSGPVTIHLENVPFDDAFKTIMALKGFVGQQAGNNILRILKPQTLTEERAKAATFTKIVALNYADAAEVKSNLDSVRNAEGRKGAIQIDARTNSLIVTDTPQGLESISSLIRQLDEPPKQVLIEAKIIEIKMTDALSLGINWSAAAGTQKQNAAGDYTGDNLLVGQTQVAGGGSTAFGAKSIDASGNVSILPETVKAANFGTGVSLPTDTSVGLALAYLKDDLYITAQLNALIKNEKARLLSNPKITTLNNKEASIEVAEQVPYTKVTTDQGVTTAETVFVDVGIKLHVTPVINADNKITLEIEPEVSNLISNDAATGPQIGTRKAKTTVLIRNGETLVIGGLIKEDKINSESKVPFFGDLPILGYLFKNRQDSTKRTELLVFITPTILVE